MTLEQILNVVNCSVSGILGTGLNYCKFDLKRVTTIILTRRGFVFDKEREFNLEYFQELQQTGDAVVLQGVESMVDNTAEDNTVTLEGSGIIKYVGKNPYTMAFTFDNGFYFHKALNSLEGANRWNVILGDSEGNLLMTQTKAGDVKGFTVGALSNGRYGWSNGATANSQTINMQLLNRSEVDDLASWVTSENLDFSPQSDLQGINDTQITLDSPAIGGTTITFSVKTIADEHAFNQQGLTATDFRYTNAGTVQTITNVAPTSTVGTYTATVPTIVAGAVTLQTWDSALQTPIIMVNTDLLKSNEATSVAA